MKYEHLSISQEGEASWVTLDRPQRLNALNRRLIHELRHYFTTSYWRSDVRVVVLKGAGRNFCAGLDLKDFSMESFSGTARALTRQREISEIVIAMRRCPQPIITLIDGAASGGGFALALASDVRIATDSARMNAAFIKVGLSACDIGVSYFLPRMVGSSVASELLLTGRFLDATRAAKLGLVSQIVQREALDSKARVLVQEMLATTPLGLRMTKDALNHAIDASGLEAVVALEDRNQVLCAQGEDFAEGISAFLEKRAPRYSPPESG
jgi:enoyl-CoA hydratase/carnithine racemase